MTQGTEKGAVEEQEARVQYIERFVAFAGRVERLLLRLIAVSVVLLAVAQALLLHEGIRFRISKVDRVEGVRIDAGYLHPINQGTD